MSNKKVISFFLCIVIVFFSMANTKNEVYAASEKVITLEQVITLALSNDKEYQRTYNKIEIKRVKYVAAVKSIKMKIKNMTTFRWSPLLNFKFPEQPKLVDEYEWQYKPVQIQSEITSLQHKLIDCKYATIETVSLLYTQAYVAQEKITYLETIISDTEKEKKRLEAKKENVDKLQQSIDKKKSELLLQMRNLAAKKEKITQKIKMNINTGYRFENTLYIADIPRSELPGIEKYTIDRDQNFYESKLNERLSYTSLTMIEKFMSNKFGGNMSLIQPYVNQAKNGQDINQISFKKSYDIFLNVIDYPWNGYKRIIFVKINRVWFKGAADGSRYVEDDPYALYSASLDYKDAKEDKDAMEKEIKNRVKDDYENLVTAKNAYESTKVYNQQLKENVVRALEQNRNGAFPYEELKELQEEYEKAKIDEMDAMSTYCQLLYAYDRFTCGAISQYLKRNGLNTQYISGGDSYVSVDQIEGAYYYIESKIEDQIFMLGVSIPDDFTIEITDFELWVNDTLIGTRTKKDEQLRHLTLDYMQTESVTIRLYNEQKLVEICEIDPNINRDKLLIRDNYQVVKDTKELRKVATFNLETDKEKKLTTIHFQKELQEIMYYTIQDKNGIYIYDDKQISIEQDYTYLSMISKQISELKISFYDGEKQLLFTGFFDPLSGSIFVE